MARKRYPRHPVRDAFLRQLLALHQACGSPAYSLVARTSDRLNETHPVPGGSASLPPLSKTALSETLNGHRKGLPDHGFVASFVLSCYRIAHEQGIIAEDPGRDALPRWQEMLREAEEEAERRGLPQRRRPTGPIGQAGPAGPAGRSGPAAAVPGRGAVPPLPFPDGGPRSPAESAAEAAGDAPAGRDLTAPVRLTAVQYDLLAAHGAFGRALAHRVQARDPRAVYQAAVLIAAAPGRDEDAVSLLTIAAAASNPDALELLQASPRELDRATAAAHADDLAREAYTTGHPQAARAFRACALALDGSCDAADPGDGAGTGLPSPDTAGTP
ncbi:hypothetical protein ACQP1W_16105 [Spirillospora sp. CA-255316]